VVTKRADFLYIVPWFMVVQGLAVTQQ